MPTIVHVIITGIVSLIPVPPADGGGYIVRLQDARSPGMHHPSLMSVRAAVSGASLGNPKASAVLEGDLEVAAWTMRQNGPIRVVNTIRDTTLQMETPYLLEIADGCASVRDCSVPKPANTYAHVDLRISKGTIVTTNVTDEKWYFNTQSESAERPLAQEVCWTFMIDDPALQLELPGLGLVSIAALPSTRAIELRLQNTLEGDLIPSLPKDEEEAGEQTPEHEHDVEQAAAPEKAPEKVAGMEAEEAAEEDRHVGLYFALSKEEPARRPYLLSNEAAGDLDPPLPTHPVHELDGDSVAGRRLETSDLETGGEAAIRINCPPALWK